MVFDVDADTPTTPGIARILFILGMLSLIMSGVFLLGAFSGLAWVNPTYSYFGAAGAFMFAVVMVGQAKAIELLAVVSARLKSRFALEATLRAQQQPASNPDAPKPAAPVQPQKERVISI